ncbi:MAG: hypothetical protein PHP08_00050 [Candidatus Dojkabacteria bacterium]|nr:hypothetical protein [Candidatus Dojkabacteria bacterium]
MKKILLISSLITALILISGCVEQSVNSKNQISKENIDIITLNNSEKLYHTEPDGFGRIDQNKINEFMSRNITVVKVIYHTDDTEFRNVKSVDIIYKEKT